MSKKINKPLAYAWAAYVMTHFPEEMKMFRKYGTPSDELLKLSCKAIEMTLANGETKFVTFPKSLNTAAGQKLLFQIVERIDLHLKCIPIKAHDLFQHVKSEVTHRRKDTQANLHMVAEAICHRAAVEFKTEVLFAFDSINVWIKAVYGKELGYHTIRKALELLQESQVIKVVEWGVRGNRSRATKIEILPVLRKSVLFYSPQMDDWLLFNDHAMTAVYRRESTTRQDVLEHAIHMYAEKLDLKEEAELFVDEKIQDGTVGRLFPGMSVMMEPRKLERLHSSGTTDRFLGDVVLTMQEIIAIVGKDSAGIRRQARTG